MAYCTAPAACSTALRSNVPNPRASLTPLFSVMSVLLLMAPISWLLCVFVGTKHPDKTIGVAPSRKPWALHQREMEATVSPGFEIPPRSAKARTIPVLAAIK